jgi:hypothetical protein
MSRFKVETKRTQAKGVMRGTIRWQIDHYNNSLALFSPVERNAILRDGMRAAGEYWLSIFFPKRFTDYAKMLGYHITEKYRIMKVKRYGEARPLILTGTLAEKANAGANVTAMSTANKQTATVHIPNGHPIAPIVSKVLATVPESEVNQMAEFFGKTIICHINNANTTDPHRAVLSVLQRQSLGIKQRATYGSKIKTNRRV